MGWVKISALVALIAAAVLRAPAPLVRTTAGLVRGRLAHDATHYVYYGVPYARVDDTNRFQAPKPTPKWDGILEAVNENIRCPQKMVGSIVLGEPDCLKLNIYTPVRSNREKLLPVMVYIHGGCFFEGTGAPTLYGGDYFGAHGVVFVTINYRLNVEGFLCLGIKEAPGNAGLKDQIAALRWIKENIAAFGGNPDSVTVFGESAGAVSTSLLMLSRAAQGLFHRAILQSGSSLAPWGLQHDPIESASALVKEFGHDTKDPYEIYSILSNKTVEELINGIKYSKHKIYTSAEVLFSPCVENEIPGEEAVFTKYPADIILSGNYNKVPMIIGYNDKEGIYLVGKDYGTDVKEFNPGEMFQPDLEFPSEKYKNETIEDINKFYFSTEKEDYVTDVVEFYSDLHVKFPSAIESELYAKTTDQPIYYYLFKYSGSINMPKIISNFWWMKGASHADELFYMFKPHLFPLPHRFIEMPMIKKMITMWTNFAKFGDPTPSSSPLLSRRWLASKAANPVALVIDSTLGTGPFWDPASVAFWNNTYARFRRRRYGFTSH